MEILQKLFAFSEYMNFTIKQTIFEHFSVLLMNFHILKAYNHNK